MGTTESWIYFWTTLGATALLCVAEGRFSVKPNAVLFDKALEDCQADGSFLANIANMAEVSEILVVVSDALQALNPQNLVSTQRFSYWIGLKSGPKDCVETDQPLKGFKWIVDVNSDVEVGRWSKEPPKTCTGTLCVLLSGTFNGTDVVAWGLESKSCMKATYPFLCRKAEGGVPEPLCPDLEVHKARSQRREQHGQLMVECVSGEIHLLSCSASTHSWLLSNGSAADGDICLCHPGFEEDNSGICVDVDECMTNPCKRLCSNTPGSYICQCYGPDGNVHNEGAAECDPVLTSSEPPTTVAVTDPHVILVTNPVDTPTPAATVSGMGSRPPPTLPPASVALPASPTNSSQGEEVQERTNVLIPVLIAVMGLVVLVVLVLVVVKCCLRRRSQQLAMKKAEKMAMKRAEAHKDDRLNGTDSMERTNEKEAT